MIQKVIGIIANTTCVTDENMLETNCGNTEAWIINIANTLSSKNYHVVVFANIGYHHIYKNVEYLPINSFYSKCSRQYFDAILCIKYFDIELLNIIEREQCCNNIWLVSHDIFFWKELMNKSIIYNEDILPNNFLAKSIKGLIVMSDWHKDINSKYWPENKIHVIRNILDFNDFDKENIYTKSIKSIIHDYIEDKYSWDNVANILINTIL